MVSRIYFWVAIGILVCLSIVLVIATGKIPTLANLKDAGESLKPIVEIVAIIIAGLWSYRLFIKNRVDYPSAEIKHTISHYCVKDSNFYLSVIVTIKNAGTVLMELDSAKIYIQQVRPLLGDLEKSIQNSNPKELREGKVSGLFQKDGAQIAWRELGYREITWARGDIMIEPGESEEFAYDFIFNENVQTVKVITYYRNIRLKKPNLGWLLTTIYDIKGDQDEKHID